MHFPLALLEYHTVDQPNAQGSPYNKDPGPGGEHMIKSQEVYPARALVIRR